MRFSMVSALMAAAATGVAAGVTPFLPHAVRADPPTKVKRDVAALATDTGFAAVGKINTGPFPADLNGSNKTYTWPVHTFEFESNGAALQMAYMDVPPCCMPNGKTLMMLHGKNFCSETWRDQIYHFTEMGFRVLALDNLGFCKSSKNATMQYSLAFQVWAYKGLLDALNLDTVVLMGHSYGGMLGTMFSFLMPQSIELFVSLDAIGAEPYTGAGLKYAPIDANIKQEASSNTASITGYESLYYYVGDMPDAAKEWVDMLNNIYWGSERNSFIQIQARIVDIVLTQPTTSYYPLITVPTFFTWGEKDLTYIGQWDPNMNGKLGNWKEFAPKVCASMKNCTAHQFDTYGHSTQVSNPPLYNQVTGDWIFSAMA
ncbi:putative aminoacrylate hydrolase RutD [Escovopsis weberi]|uniref:Putative aminoacrylate hydrolase RutD n=1 Tax=Escovopsis weberi TaxID=150374 RepID=A0A0M8MYC8_ESCWE|nr:putative aminoacrylate hydrolase RutD [Escovopsis weberi]